MLPLPGSRTAEGRRRGAPRRRAGAPRLSGSAHGPSGRRAGGVRGWAISPQGRGRKAAWPGPPARPRGMVWPGPAKARGRRRGLRPRRYGTASWRSARQSRSGPGGSRRTRAEQRRSGRQHPLGLHRRRAQRAPERAHPATAVCAGPGQGAKPRGHDPGKATERPARGRVWRREVALDARGDWSQAPPEVSICCVTLSKWLSLSGPVSSLEQGGLDEMINIAINNTYKESTCSAPGAVLVPSCQPYEVDPTIIPLLQFPQTEKDLSNLFKVRHLESGIAWPQCPTA